MELPVWLGDFVWHLLSLDPRAEIPGVGGNGVVDCSDVAAWAGKFAESESVAVVADFVRTRAAGAWLCGLPFSCKYLADRTGRRGLVFLWPQHGGKNGDAGACRFVVRRNRADSTRAYVGGATRHVDVRHRNPDATLAHRDNGNRIFVHHGRRHVAEFSRALAVSLRSVVGRDSTSANTDARDDRDQHFGGRRSSVDRNFPGNIRAREHSHCAGHELWSQRGCGFLRHVEVPCPSRCLWERCMVLAGRWRCRGRLFRYEVEAGSDLEKQTATRIASRYRRRRRSRFVCAWLSRRVATYSWGCGSPAQIARRNGQDSESEGLLRCDGDLVRSVCGRIFVSRITVSSAGCQLELFLSV